MIPNLIDNFYLLAQMVHREVHERYRGSMLGLVWSFVLPLLMLGVYMFVFSVVFQIRWGVERESNVDFGVILFAGLIVHTLLSDCLTRSPSVITGNAQFVKKVVFPLEILPMVVLGTALFHFIISVIILLVFVLLSGSGLPATVLWLPVVIAPLVMLCAGVSWVSGRAVGLPQGYWPADGNSEHGAVIPVADVLPNKLGTRAMACVDVPEPVNRNHNRGSRGRYLG